MGETPLKIFEITETVRTEDTAEMVGSGGLPVLATPRLAALLEKAAFELLGTSLSEGKSSVGTALSLRHLSPTPVGLRVTAKATLESFDGRTAEFTLAAADERGEIASGVHTRAVIDVERFMKKASEKLNP